MRKLLPGMLILLLFFSFNTHAKECVVLLHGLARTAGAMEKMAKALNEAGYVAVNIDYPSRDYAIEILAPMVVPAALGQCVEQKATPIHFVTHSMGGILLRYYLQDQTIANLGRVVMMGPPNQGSQVVDKLKSVPGFAAFNGPAGLQLGTGDEDIPKKLGAVNFELGVIAGTRSINWILSRYLPNPDDGKVSVENTRVDGMCALVTVPVTHPYLMKRKKVFKQVVSFLENGTIFGEAAQQIDCAAQKHLPMCEGENCYSSTSGL